MDNKIHNTNDYKNISSIGIGNFTKNAIKEFENHIVTERNYLEKFNENLKNEKNNKHS